MAGFSYIKIIRGLYPVGSRAVVRMGKDRYIVYLPISLNYLWSELHQNKIKVRVFIEIPEED